MSETPEVRKVRNPGPHNFQMRILQRSKVSTVLLYTNSKGQNVVRKSTRYHVLHQRERELLKTLGKIDVLDHGFTPKDGFYVEMAFLEGGDLWDRLHGEKAWKLSLTQILNLILDVIDQLYKLREIGYIHGDLSLENILIHPKKGAAICDLEDCAPLQASFPLPPRGKAGYAALEIRNVEFQGPYYDRSACDVYSLGKCLLFLLSRCSEPKIWRDTGVVELCRGMTADNWTRRFTLETCLECIEEIKRNL